ncbi:hypothetical protein, partial [Vibrio parahaemolyticus]|uniref:hypothetical protein n=1 Tax=Vibrio parahaemolyticus TaxID=670 RepID=UPI001E62B4C3
NNDTQQGDQYKNAVVYGFICPIEAKFRSCLHNAPYISDKNGEKFPISLKDDGVRKLTFSRLTLTN